MSRKRLKHLPYFHVLDAVRKAQECPICHLEHEGVRRYLDSLLYESVNDPDVRAGLVQSRGYCCRHAHLLLCLQKGLATAILYQDQVRELMAFISGISRGAGVLRPRKAGDQWNTHAQCPACRIQMQERDRAVSVLLEWLHDDEMRLAFEASAGLCAPHFLIVLDAAKADDLRRYLIAFQQDRLGNLLHELEEFSRKHDYRFAREGFGKERDSWRRAILMMVGREDVF